MSEFKQRFAGVERLYGEAQTQVFNNSHVVIIGVGGVGSWVAESLARTAIGALTLIDLDDICSSNTNRQIHTLSQHIGQSKIAVMAARIKAINPDCEVHEIEDFVSAENIPELISKDVDYLVDAIDSVKDKAALIAYAKRYKIPVISIGGAGGQIDPSQIKIADLSKTSHDPLSAKVRNYLRRYYGFSQSGRRFAVDTVYSTEQLKYHQSDGSIGAKPQAAGGRLDCASGFGASVAVTASFGFMAAARILDKILARHQRQQAK